MPVKQVLEYLRSFAPLELAEEWDNVGLLLGGRVAGAGRILTCLTLTPDVAEEAIEFDADLIVTHHPILFRPVQRLVDDSADGAMLLDLIRNDIAVYSPHTAFDSAARGINQQWAERLQLSNIKPLRPLESDAAKGSGRYGRLPAPVTLSELIDTVKGLVGLETLQYVGRPDRRVQTLGVACGAAAEYQRDARKLGCDVLITGEARFHACLEARNSGIGLILTGHYASERFACEELARLLKLEFPAMDVRASNVESDPLAWR